MADNQKAPIIIKKIKKAGHGGHHGGAWKVAYADFVTAMMAFFLLLWLLNATTEAQKKGIADYFDPVSVSKSSSGSGGVMGGVSISSKGSLTSIAAPMRPHALSGVKLPPKKDKKDSNGGKQKEKESVKIDKPTPQDIEKHIVQKREQENFDRVEKELVEAVKATPDLKSLSENLLIEHTDRGLRIQIIDRSKTSMFDRGSSKMYGYTRKLLEKISEVIVKLSNKIEITGHTDSTPYRFKKDFSNWDLSTLRANASRRVLEESGYPEDRVDLVSGKSDKEPLVPTDPSAPMNRRISIILLREEVTNVNAPQKKQLMADEIRTQ
jgi:chemotaxis protein MotB